jgi:hypothetical protein
MKMRVADQNNQPRQASVAKTVQRGEGWKPAFPETVPQTPPRNIVRPTAAPEFQQAMFHAAVQGSQAYFEGQQGNSYTDYLKSQYGHWGEAQGADAVSYIQNTKGAPIEFNQSMDPASTGFVASGLPMVTEAAAGVAVKNVALQGMHPARRRRAVNAILAYTYPQAKSMHANAAPKDFAMAHGEMAQSVPQHDLNDALAMYEVSGDADVGSHDAAHYIDVCRNVAARTQTDFSSAYTHMIQSASKAARHLNYLKMQHDLNSFRSFTDISSALTVKHNAEAMQHILDAASKGMIASHGKRNQQGSLALGALDKAPLPMRS